MSRMWCAFVAAVLASGLAVGFAGAQTSASSPAVETSPATASAPSTAPAASDPAGRLKLTYFFSPTCLKCKEAAKTVEAVEKAFAPRLLVERVDSTRPEGMELLLDLETRYGVKSAAPPRVFVGRRCLTGLDEIQGQLATAVREELAAGEAHSQPAEPATRPAGMSLKEHFQSFSPGMIVIAGLVDGINPCAFTTAVFLISMLTYLGKSRREVAAVGGTFTVAVFGTYLGLGLGAFSAIQIFSVTHGVSAALTYVIAGMALFFGTWSLIDGIRFTISGEVPAGALGLPKSVKQSIHKIIRGGLKIRNLLLGSFAIGCLVSLLESICTGQTYLPTIMAVLNIPDLRNHAVGYLVLYNFLFVAPLAAIVCVSCWGVGSERIGAVMRSNLGVVKSLLAALFIGLGVLLIVTV